jgi:parvulin-like peptidyl-prolyl isomerase
MIDSDSSDRHPDREQLDFLQTQATTADLNTPTLALGEDCIPFDVLLQQLQDFQLLPRLVEEIILDEVLERTVLDQEIDLDYDSVEFKEWYDRVKQSRLCQGMNSQQLTAITERELKLQKFKQLRWGHQVEDYFHSQQRKLDRVVISILKVANPLLARDLYFRLQDREQSFAEIALKYSQDRYRHQGGILGPLALRDLAPPIGKVVIKLQPGELSHPFPVGKYHVLIRLDELQPAQLDNRMYQFLLDEMFSIWVKLLSE